MRLYKSSGILQYSDSGWATLACCEELARYYRSTLKKPPQILQKPKYGSHITVASAKWERSTNKHVWGKYAGQEIEFEYYNHIHHDGGFYWLRVECEFLTNLRKELGLLSLRNHKFLTRPLHLTLARDLRD